MGRPFSIYPTEVDSSCIEHDSFLTGSSLTGNSLLTDDSFLTDGSLLMDGSLLINGSFLTSGSSLTGVFFLDGGPFDVRAVVANVDPRLTFAFLGRRWLRYSANSALSGSV